jgi:hypothetical protein
MKTKFSGAAIAALKLILCVSAALFGLLAKANAIEIHITYTGQAYSNLYKHRFILAANRSG